MAGIAMQRREPTDLPKEVFKQNKSRDIISDFRRGWGGKGEKLFLPFQSRYMHECLKVKKGLRKYDSDPKEMNLSLFMKTQMRNHLLSLV